MQYSNLISTLFAYLRPVAFRDGFGVTALIFHSYLLISIPVYVKKAINGLETGISSSELGMLSLSILGLALAAAITLFFARWAIIGASRQIEMNLRNDFLAHIQKLTPRFYQQIKTGDLVLRFSSDIEQARLLMGPGIMYPSTTSFIMVLALYSMFSVDVSLAFTLLIPITVLLVYVNFNTRKLHKFYRQAQECYSDLTAQVQENFSGIRVIKAYCQEEEEFNRFKEINDRYLDRNIAQIKMRGKLFPFMRFIGGLGIVLILWRGGLKVIDGNLRLGDLVQFTIYYQMLLWPIIALGWIINVIHRGTTSWRRLQSILTTEPEITDSPHLAAGPPLEGEIEMNNVTFSYNEHEPPVLKDVSFKVKPGHTLAIVGPTGSGKTTIVNLLLHLYSIPPGSIFYDGRDINDIPLSKLWQSIAYVSQEVFLFSNTIRENILFGVTEPEKVSDKEMIAAAERAQLHREIKDFPEGYDTQIGERGISLSGGQKQRTGIARALILNRPILILDDCLSSVDTQTEEAILKGLQDAIHQSSSIIISHRISTVKNADHIIVLDEGRIVEEGDHDFLIANKGLYTRIYKRQLLEESLGIRT